MRLTVSLILPLSVALRKESVDRNTMRRDFKSLGLLSLSARRAWIEMLTDDVSTGGKIKVALRKESVDRNFDTMQIIIVVVESLSARRAWIEINSPTLCWIPKTGRSPQGERG